jgi:hypothetical protein
MEKMGGRGTSLSPGSAVTRTEPNPHAPWGASQGETRQGMESLNGYPAVLLSLPTVRHLTRCEEPRDQGREGVGEGGEANDVGRVADVDAATGRSMAQQEGTLVSKVVGNSVSAPVRIVPGTFTR